MTNEYGGGTTILWFKMWLFSSDLYSHHFNNTKNGVSYNRIRLQKNWKQAPSPDITRISLIQGSSSLRLVPNVSLFGWKLVFRYKFIGCIFSILCTRTWISTQIYSSTLKLSKILTAGTERCPQHNIQMVNFLWNVDSWDGRVPYVRFTGPSEPSTSILSSIWLQNGAKKTVLL